MLRCCLRAASTAPRSQVPRPKVQPDKTPKPSRSPRVPVSPQGQLVFHRPSGTLYSLQSPEDEQQLLARSRTEVPITPRTDKVTFAQTTWTPASLRLNELPAIYASLVKARLTGLVVISGLAGYCMCPGPVVPGVLLAFTGGTALLSASANSLNQWLEIPYDSQMKRTLGRPLVRGVISPIHALTVSGVCCVSGFWLLSGLGGSMAAAGLGLANVFLYAGVYTPMKRYSIGCTWAGALVGAIPPLMGWAASGGTAAAAPALCLAAILYAWQFPHFNGLSWNLRPDYSRAGYRVMCVTAPDLCLRTTLRHSVALVGLCSLAAPLTGLTTWTFAVDSLPLNIGLCYLSYKFYQAPDSQNSRKLFRYTLLYLPALMLFMLISKPFPSIADSPELPPPELPIDSLVPPPG